MPLPMRIAVLLVALSSSVVYGHYLASIAGFIHGTLTEPEVLAEGPGHVITASNLQAETAKALQGDLAAQLGLAHAYGYGKGVAQDFQQMLFWTTRAAGQGSADAQFYLGSFYYNGFADIIAPDNGKAFFWFSLAARAKHPQARVLRSEAAARLSPAQLDTIRHDVNVWREKTP